MRARKSVLLAVLLTAFFGPLGMLYTTVSGAIVMFLVNLLVGVIGFLTLGVGYLLYIVTWIIGLIWAANAARRINDEIDLLIGMQNRSQN